MIWILKDGEKEVGWHYELERLLKVTDNYDAIHDWSITWENGDLD